MSYTDVGCWLLLGLLPSGGNNEYEGARACPRDDLEPAAGPGLDGISPISSNDFGENGLFSVGEVLSDSMLMTLPFSIPIKLARLVALLESSLCDLGPVTGSTK
jgi:hypothetical protein